MTDPIGVLHVDDDTEFAERAADHFGRTTHAVDVHIEESVSEASDRLETTAIDCIVSAFDLPGKDGLAFLQTVREEYPQLPFVLCTDEEAEAIASDAFMIGATDCLVKGNLSNQHTVLANRVLNYAEKVRAERESQRRLEAMDVVRDGLCTLDGDGTFRSVNPAFADYYGYEPGDVIGEHWDFLHPEDALESIFEAPEHGEADASGWRSTVTARHADGNTAAVNLVLSRTDDGAFVCSIEERPERRDTSPSDSAPGQQRRELQRYRNLIDTVAEPVCLYDESGRFEVVNESLASYFDTTPSDLEGQESPMVEDIRETSASDPFAELVAGSRNEITGEFEMEFPGRGERILEYQLTRLVVDGDVDGIVAVARDTTARKRREATLGELHRATRTFMEAPDQQTVAERAVETAETVLEHPITGIWLSDETGETLRPVAATDEKLELIGDISTYERGDGLTWQAFESGEVLVSETARKRRGPAVTDGPLASQIILPLGKYGVLSVGATTADAFEDVDVSLARVLANTTEAALDRAAREDELRTQQFELERQNERLEDFASILSHDLRNPLQVFRGVLDGVEADDDSDHVERGHRTIDRMETMIDDLLALARQGNSIEERDVVDLRVVAEESWKNVDTGECTLHVETDRKITANELRVKQLLENLFDNSVEHGGENLTITVGDLGYDAGFFVEDDGSGIPDSEKAKVFERGYSTSRRGTGFGLAIVLEVANAHGWELDVTESEAGGARFEIAGVTLVE